MKIKDSLPSLSYSLNASLSSACMASASSSTINLEAKVMNSSNSSSPDPKIQLSTYKTKTIFRYFIYHLHPLLKWCPVTSFQWFVCPASPKLYRSWPCLCFPSSLRRRCRTHFWALQTDTKWITSKILHCLILTSDLLLRQCVVLELILWNYFTLLDKTHSHTYRHCVLFVNSTIAEK